MRRLVGTYTRPLAMVGMVKRRALPARSFAPVRALSYCAVAITGSRDFVAGAGRCAAASPARQHTRSGTKTRFLMALRRRWPEICFRPHAQLEGAMASSQGQLARVAGRPEGRPLQVGGIMHRTEEEE